MQLTAQYWTTQSIRNTPVKSFTFLVCPLWVVSRWCNSLKIKISTTLHRENCIWRFPSDSVVTSTDRLLYQPWKKYSALFWQLCHSSGRKISVFHSASANAVISNPKHGRKWSAHTGTCALLPTIPPSFKAQQQQGSDLKCHSQVVISYPVNMCQMIASFP